MKGREIKFAEYFDNKCFIIFYINNFFARETAKFLFLSYLFIFIFLFLFFFFAICFQDNQSIKLRSNNKKLINYF